MKTDSDPEKSPFPMWLRVGCTLFLLATYGVLALSSLLHAGGAAGLPGAVFWSAAAAALLAGLDEDNPVRRRAAAAGRPLAVLAGALWRRLCAALRCVAAFVGMACLRLLRPDLYRRVVLAGFRRRVQSLLAAVAADREPEFVHRNARELEAVRDRLLRLRWDSAYEAMPVMRRQMQAAARACEEANLRLRASLETVYPATKEGADVRTRNP